MIPVLKGTGGGGDAVKVVAESTSELTVDLAEGNVYDVTLTANCTISLSGLAASGRRSLAMLVLRQDATGGRTVTWPAATKWPSGTAPTISSGAEAVSIVELWTLDGGTTIYGRTAGLAYG